MRCNLLRCILLNKLYLTKKNLFYDKILISFTNHNLTFDLFVGEDSPSIGQAGARYIPSLQCYVCQTNFDSHEALTLHIEHVQFHGYKKMCQICSKPFNSRSALKYHLSVVHSFYSNYKCDKCDRTFPTRTYLLDHARRHSEEASFVCPHCKKSYKHKSNLGTHLKYNRCGKL